MNTISNLIISYLKTSTNLHGQIIKSVEDSYICLTFFYHNYDITVEIYNESFIKLKVDNLPYAICDSIKTFRTEIDRLNTLRYY